MRVGAETVDVSAPFNGNNVVETLGKRRLIRHPREGGDPDA